MQSLLTLIFCFLPFLIHSYTRTDQLPQGFVWQYLPDENLSQPRGGLAWRAGLIDAKTIFLLSTDTLVALKMDGSVIWRYQLPAEGLNSEAKILPFDDNHIIVALTDAILKIKRSDGNLVSQYSYDSSKGQAFRPTLLLPRYTFIYNKNIYSFIGPQLLRFDGQTLERKEVISFSSPPKTLPVFYPPYFAVGFDNGFFEIFNPETKDKFTLISGSPKKDFRIRQPVIRDDLLFVPATDELLVYQGREIFARNANLTNAILSFIEGRIWLRGHNTGLISEIDETLSTLREGRYASPIRASVIDAPLVGISNRALHLEAQNGGLTIIDTSKDKPTVVKSLVSEDFDENPPLSILANHQELVLIGGFDGVFLIDLTKF
ncbi:MAG: hypothetical protein ACRC9L_00200 [Brevinema sp.]